MEVPDKGWSWVIVLACFSVSFVLAGIFRTSGVLFVAFISNFRVTREAASWPMVVCIAVLNLVGPFCGILGRRFGARPVVICGALIATAGVSSCYFTTSLNTITILFGGIFGIGYGFMNTVTPVILNVYFTNLKATANGIANTGSCFGSMILPTVYDFLITTYGLSGCFLLTGGLILHLTIAGFLMRPPPWLEKAQQANVKRKLLADRKASLNLVDNVICNKCASSDQHITITEKPNQSDKVQVHQHSMNSRSDESSMESDANNQFVSNNMSFYERKQYIAKCRSPNSTNMQSECQNNSDNLNNLSSFHCHHDDNEKTDKSDLHSQIKPSNNSPDLTNPLTNQRLIVNEKKSISWKNVSSLSKTNVLYSFKTVLSCPMFYVIATTNVCFYFLYHMYVVIIIDYALDLSVHESSTKYILFVFSIADLFGRLCLGWITDCKFVSRARFVMICMILIGLNFFMFAIAAQYSVLLLASSLYGVFLGCTMVIFPILLADFCGVENHAVSYGCMCFMNGFANLGRPFLIGHFRDNIGSYSSMFYILGIMSIILSFLWLLEKHFERKQEDQLPQTVNATVHTIK